MFKLNEAILDITEIKDEEIAKTLREFASYHEYGQQSFYRVDVFDINEFLDSEEEIFKEGWYRLLSEMKKANIFEFTLLYWW